MTGNVVKNHFIFFDFQRMFHSSDVFCTRSCLFVRPGFRLLYARLAVHYFAVHSRRLHTTPGEFENGGFTLKPHQMLFCSHYGGGIWKLNNHRSFWICV